MEKGNSKPTYARVNTLVFWICVLACLAFYGPMVVFQDAAQSTVDKVMYFITHHTDWLWEFVVFGCLVFLGWLALGRYGNVKLGGPDDKPEFSTFTWVAMMFCGGTGASTVYWALIEPIYYLQYPPYWMEAFSPQAAQFAIGYGIFHWGFSAWATFGVPAVAFAYMYYVRRKPYLYPSYACRGVFGKCVDGWFGRVIDAVVIIGMIGGMATTLGFVIPMLSGTAASYFGVTDTMGFKLLICTIFSAIYCYSAWNGLKSGIAKLADYNMYLSFALLAFVMIVGPTAFMISLFSDNFGVLLNNFVRMSFYTDPITKSGFPQDWTVFYWAWWASWTMYVGLFAARISKGRTIKSLVFNMVFSATGGCVLFFMIFGGYQVDAIMNQGLKIADILANQGGPAVVANFLQGLPASALVIPFFLVTMAISSATGLDAASYTMANMSCIEVRDGIEPPKWIRLFWALMIFFAAVGLMLVGGLKVVQLSSVLTSIPQLLLLIVLAIGTVKWLREDFGYAEPLITHKYKDYTDTTPIPVQGDAKVKSV